MVIEAIDGTIAALEARAESGWEQHIETLERLRLETIDAVRMKFAGPRLAAPDTAVDAA